jgi:hypothetical protein
MRVTGFGRFVLGVLLVCVVVAILASGPLQILAISVACFVLALVAGEGIGSGFANPDANLGRMGEFARKREVLRRYARPRRRPPDGHDRGK